MSVGPTRGVTRLLDFERHAVAATIIPAPIANRPGERAPAWISLYQWFERPRESRTFHQTGQAQGPAPTKFDKRTASEKTLRAYDRASGAHNLPRLPF